MYLYDTRYDDNTMSRFPIEGWLFPCWNCGEISSYKKPLFYNKKIIYVPHCKYCKYFDIPSQEIKRYNIKFIPGHYLV